MTNKLASLVLAATVLAACAPASDPAQAFRDALPKKEAVQIGTPSAAGSTAGASYAREALPQTAPNYQSEYAQLSYWTAVTVNVGVWWTLALVQTITTFPPTICDASSCTWGPWVDDDGLNRWKLHVDKAGASYVWALSAQPGSNAAAPFVDLITGTSYPGADKDHGHGNFTVDFDAQDGLDHGALWQKKDYGQLAVDYDNRVVLAIDATFLGARNQDPNDPHFMNAIYSFQATGAGGELQLGVRNLTTAEVVTLRTRWNAAGAGRGDAHYNGPDGAGGRLDYFATECWAGQADGFVKVFDDKPEPDFGAESSCAFIPALFANVTVP